MAAIILSTLNARYFHCALGLRYLRANMGALRDDCAIAEFTIDSATADIVERLLEQQPRIVGFGVYIWNVEQTTRVVAQLKKINPDILIVIGGPEVSYEWEEQDIVRHADYLITGMADLRFAEVCAQLLQGNPPPERIIHAPPPPVSQLAFPYAEYTDEDVQKRFIYVEASRGCPFKCEFCLSALDKTAWPFALDEFLARMDALHQRGARHFKFVDRTFNLKIESSARILEFFLARLDERLFLHFEAIPDHLPDRLKELIRRFPPGSLQFEIGIQTFNPDVQQRISRRQDNAKTDANLHWLRAESHVHIHADLIAGLPGETLESFGEGFDRLVALDPHEIQVGILKRLRGAPIDRHSAAHAMRYNPYPPYNILSTDVLDFTALQRLGRFARYWDLIANSGRFPHSKTALLGDRPFARFLHFSDWLFAQTGQTHAIALAKLFYWIHRGLREGLGEDADTAHAALFADYERSGMKGRHNFAQLIAAPKSKAAGAAATPARQARHLRAG